MEQTKLKFARGYLLVFSAVIITIAALVATLILTMTSGGIKSTENVIQSDSALYLATSGLEIAKRNILVNNTRCKNINRNPLYTNNSISGINGKYTVNCYLHQANGYLNGSINATDKNIPLQSIVISNNNILASSLSDIEASEIVLQDINYAKALPLNGGIIRVDDEYIAYGQRNGATLNDLRRGINNTISTAHNIGSVVSMEFLKSGFIRIDDEIIRYNNINGSTLTEITRGVMGTSASDHDNSDPVYQKEILLYSEAGVPNLDNPTGKRLVKETLSMNTTPFDNIGSAFKIDNYYPTLASTGSVSLDDNTHIQNHAIINENDPYFAGSNIVTTDNNIKIKPDAYTEIRSGIISTNDSIEADVQENHNFTLPLFDYFFAVDLNAIINDAEVILSPNQLTNLSQPSNANKIVLINDNVTMNDDNQQFSTGSQTQPKIVIINGNLKITGKDSSLIIGTEDDPTVFIVTGDIQITGQTGNRLEIYGLAYIKGDFSNNGEKCKSDNDDDNDTCDQDCRKKCNKKYHLFYCYWKCKKYCHHHHHHSNTINTAATTADDHKDCNNSVGCSDNDDESEPCNKLLVDGFLAVEGKVDFKKDVEINSNPDSIGRLKISNEYLNYNFHNVPYSTQEIFQ